MILSIKEYPDAAKTFYAEAGPHLQNEVAKNSLIFGLATLYTTQPENCLYQSILWDGSQVLATLMCGKYGGEINLLPSPCIDPEHARLLYTQFKKSNIQFNGIVAELATANLYLEIIQKDGYKSTVQMKQGIYRCTRVLTPNKPSGTRFRATHLSDLALVTHWIDLFAKEALPYAPKTDRSALIQDKIQKDQIYLIEHNGKQVSMAMKARETPNTCTVTFVFTPKEHRKKGYGGLVTAELTQLLLDSGKSEVHLYTDLENPTSNKIYQNIGYEFVCNSIHYGLNL